MGVLARQIIPEPIEAPLPALAPLRDPALGRAQCVGLDRHCANSADLLAAHEAALLENVQVLEHGRERDREWGGEVTDRCRPALEPLHHPPSARVGEGVEDAVEGRTRRRTTLNHPLKYSSAADGQGVFVLTPHEREPLELTGTIFHFLTD